MASMTTEQVGTIRLQDLLNAGLNGFALQLLVESYASAKHGATVFPDIDIVFRGVRVQLSKCETPEAWAREQDEKRQFREFIENRPTDMIVRDPNGPEPYTITLDEGSTWTYLPSTGDWLSGVDFPEHMLRETDGKGGLPWWTVHRAEPFHYRYAGLPLRQEEIAALAKIVAQAQAARGAKP